MNWQLVPTLANMVYVFAPWSTFAIFKKIIDCGHISCRFYFIEFAIFKNVLKILPTFLASSKAV